MKVASFQAPLLDSDHVEVIRLIRNQIDWCQSEGIGILCCPEAILGGLADHANRPADLAIDAEDGELAALLAPLASETVSTILGFTERRRDQLYNSAVVFCGGQVRGIYRKLYPAIRQSVYTAGGHAPVFEIGGLIFGVLICRDSTFSEPARKMVAQGATALFVPTNNALPLGRRPQDLAIEARETDVARATENNVWVIRADVAGQTERFSSFGASEIVNPDGVVVQSASALAAGLIVADIKGVL